MHGLCSALLLSLAARSSGGRLSGHGDNFPSSASSARTKFRPSFRLEARRFPPGLRRQPCEVLTRELPPRISVGTTSADSAGKEGSIEWKTTIFKIEGMNCDACANTIKSLVEKEPGVRMASVSFNDRQARVLYDPKSVEEKRLVDVIQRPGFRVVGREAVGEASG